MQELGISPPPREPIVSDVQLWAIWQRWLLRLTTAIPRTRTYEVTINPASFATTTSEQTFTVAGLTTKDIVTVNKPSHTSGVGIGNARVSAADTLAITFTNQTGGSVDPPSESYLIVATRL